jgi:hypothetical protein
LGIAAGRPWCLPQRPLMAPADGSGRGGRASGRKSKRGGGGSYARRGASGSYRWLAPLLRRRPSGSVQTSQARHAAGTTSQATRGAGPRGARPRVARRPWEGARGPGSRGWRPARGAARATGARAGAPGSRRRGTTSAGLTACHRTPARTLKTPEILIEVHQVVNRKVVDLTTLYNYYKGSRVFFSTDFAQSAAKL